MAQNMLISYQKYNSVLPGHNTRVELAGDKQGCRLLADRRPHMPSAP